MPNTTRRVRAGTEPPPDMPVQFAEGTKKITHTWTKAQPGGSWPSWPSCSLWSLVAPRNLSLQGEEDVKAVIVYAIGGAA